MLAGKSMFRQQLDEACESYLQETYNELVDFAIERSLPELFQDGLVTENEVRGRASSSIFHLFYHGIFQGLCARPLAQGWGNTYGCSLIILWALAGPVGWAD